MAVNKTDNCAIYKQNDIHPTTTFIPVRSADSVVREMQTVEDILGKPV